MLTELEQKLIRLALDPAAAPGEIANCARMLIEQLRKRGATFDEILGAAEGARAASQSPEYWAPDYGLCVMPFGKHRGKEFKDIPPSYLRWLLGELRRDANRPASPAAAYTYTAPPKFPNLADEIEKFLNQ